MGGFFDPCCCFWTLNPRLWWWVVVVVSSIHSRWDDCECFIQTVFVCDRVVYRPWHTHYVSIWFWYQRLFSKANASLFKWEDPIANFIASMIDMLRFSHARQCWVWMHISLPRVLFDLCYFLLPIFLSRDVFMITANVVMNFALPAPLLPFKLSLPSPSNTRTNTITIFILGFILAVQSSTLGELH